METKTITLTEYEYHMLRVLCIRGMKHMEQDANQICLSRPDIPTIVRNNCADELQNYQNFKDRICNL